MRPPLPPGGGVAGLSDCGARGQQVPRGNPQHRPPLRTLRPRYQECAAIGGRGCDGHRLGGPVERVVGARRPRRAAFAVGQSRPGPSGGRLWAPRDAYPSVRPAGRAGGAARRRPRRRAVAAAAADRGDSPPEAAGGGRGGGDCWRGGGGKGTGCPRRCALRRLRFVCVGWVLVDEWQRFAAANGSS